MMDLSLLATEIREVGESVISNSQDLFLLLNLKVSDDVEGIPKLRHGLNVVDNILTMLTYLSSLNLEKLDRNEDLMNEVNKIKFSCYGLQTTLSKTLEGGERALYPDRKNIGKLLTSINNAGNKIVTITYLLEKTYLNSNDVRSCMEESDNICYEDQKTCERYCPNGFCVEDSAVISKNRDSKCPDYIETFTQSSLTHVENGYEEKENMPWYVTPRNLNLDSGKENKMYSLWDILKRYSSSKLLNLNRDNTNLYSIGQENKYQGILTSSDEFLSGISTDQFSVLATVNDSLPTNSENTNDEPNQSVLHGETVNETNYEETSYKNELEYLTTLKTEIEVNHSPSSVEDTETTTSLIHSDSTTTESYETTTYSYYTTEPPTTPVYETTTQDMYKLSQDIYQAAQDLSSKSSELSSMSSEISSKSSDISSLVSELNNYEDDELSKKIQRVSKLTQEINSKTSEISSLTSTMSSLASDISSASSDMTSADRHHAFRTTPWQKMSSKSDDLITSAQGVVTVAQDILVKVTEVVTASADLKVATVVANMAGQITAKTQRLISEALSIVSRVIELVNVIEES